MPTLARACEVSGDRPPPPTAFSPDGKTLYTGRRGGPIQARETETGKELPAVDKGQSFTRSLVLSRDGRRLAAADHPQVRASRPEVVVWDPVDRRELRRLLPPNGDKAWALALSQDGNTPAAVGGDYAGGGASCGRSRCWRCSARPRRASCWRCWPAGRKNPC